MKNKKDYLTINVKIKSIVLSIYIYLLIPIVLFFLTWLKWYIGIPMSILLLIGFIVLYVKNYIDDIRLYSIKLKDFILFHNLILKSLLIAAKINSYKFIIAYLC